MSLHTPNLLPQGEKHHITFSVYISQTDRISNIKPWTLELET